MIKLVSNDINNVKIIVNKVEYSITKITTWLGTPLQEFTIWDAGGSAGHTHTISSTGSSSGDVTGPSSSTNNDIALFDGTTGKVIKDSGVTLPTGTIVGTTDTQTLTNKTIDGATPTEVGYLSGVSSAIQTQINALKETVLYAPETPATSGTLTDSVANYDYIEVFYNFGGAKDGAYGNNSVKIYQANNTKAALVLPVYSGGYTYLVAGQVSFSGNTFTSVSPYRTRWATTPGITITNVDNITLYRVVGYKIL